MARPWTIAALVTLALASGAWQNPPPARRVGPQGLVERSAGGYSTVSPSVVASSSTVRDSTGVVSIDLLILWRGSPGWMYRPTGSGSSSGGGPGRGRMIEFSIYQGGLHLTATYDPPLGTVDVLGERVNLKDANVVLVDRVDSPDGPVVV